MGRFPYLLTTSHNKKMFPRERTPAEILQGMLVLTRKILKKGFLHSELLECCAKYWSKATSYPPTLIDCNIRKVFKITVPQIIDTLLRVRYLKTFYREESQTCEQINATKWVASRLYFMLFRVYLDPFDPQLFLTNLMQLTTYVIATGCLSFSANPMDVQLDIVKVDYEMFWNLVLDGVSRVSGIGGSVS